MLCDLSSNCTRSLRHQHTLRRTTPTRYTTSGAARGEGGSFPSYGWTSKNYVICVCFHCHGTSSRITRQIHCKAVEQRAPLIHRRYNRDWGTSYSRPPIDTYLTSPCYKILAAPLSTTSTTPRRRKTWASAYTWGQKGSADPLEKWMKN